MDFTLHTYHKLLKTLQQQGFSFLSFSDFVSVPLKKAIVLRHDVDKLPGNSLRFARIQAEKGIIGSYYFRFVTESFNESIIREISSLGHEIGYHYEDLGAVAQRRKVSMGRGSDGEKRRGGEIEKVLVDIAIESFSENLEKLRKIVPVKTICMHGSPMSRWDSRLLWKYYDYHDFGIVGEPYFDIDFDEVFYLTDTGRRWDGEGVSVRDKAQGAGRGMVIGDRYSVIDSENPFEDWKVKPFKYRDKPLTEQEVMQGKLYPPNNIPLAPFKRGTQNPAPSTHLSTEALTKVEHPAPFPKFHSTSDIIRAAENNQLPDKIMMTFHPQRWTDRTVPWIKELVWQNVKNVGKYFIVRQQAIH